MQTYSLELELRAIKTLTSPKVPKKIRSTMLGELTKDAFHYPPCVAAFERIDAIARKRFEIVDFSDLMEDPALEEDFRDILKDSDATPCHGKKALKTLMLNIDKYRKIRIVYDMANHALDQVEADKVNIEELLNNITDRITRARKDLGTEDKPVSIGLNGNAEELVDDVLSNLVEEMIKTGFTEYDNKNGGLPEEGVMLIAATTSGGKSALLLNLLVNLYSQSKKKVCRVSLEMGDKQEMQRLLSCISGVAFWKIKQGKLTPKDKERINKSFKKFNDFGAKNNITFTSISPTRNMRIDDVFRMVKPYGYDVIGLDYVSLLDGVDEDNQWKVLSGIVRDCKVFSRETKSLIIVLCQLDEDSDKLRYSRGMKEHADVFWHWNYTKKEQRELHLLPIQVGKARDGELFGFNLEESFHIMKVDNVQGGPDGMDDDDDEGDVDLKSSRNKNDEDDDTDSSYSLS